MRDGSPVVGRWSDRRASFGARLDEERGNTMLLFPAAVLIMFVLASLAVDAAVTFAAHRQIADLATGIANDAATAVIDEAFYADGTVVIATDEAAARAAASLAARPDAARLGAHCRVDVPPSGDRVAVTCYGRVRQLVSPVRFLGVIARDVAARAVAVPLRP